MHLQCTWVKFFCLCLYFIGDFSFNALMISFTFHGCVWQYLVVINRNMRNKSLTHANSHVFLLDLDFISTLYSIMDIISYGFQSIVLLISRPIYWHAGGVYKTGSLWKCGVYMKHNHTLWKVFVRSNLFIEYFHILSYSVCQFAANESKGKDLKIITRG